MRKPRGKGRMRRAYLKHFSADVIRPHSNQMDRGGLAHTIARGLPAEAVQSTGKKLPKTKGLSQARKAIVDVIVALRRAEDIVDDFGMTREIVLDDVHKLFFIGQSAILVKKLSDTQYLRSVVFKDRKKLLDIFKFRYTTITWVSVLNRH